MWASLQSIAGADWGAQAQATSSDTMGQMDHALANIVNMLYGSRNGLEELHNSDLHRGECETEMTAQW
jgi:hypothetical protein